MNLAIYSTLYDKVSSFRCTRSKETEALTNDSNSYSQFNISLTSQTPQKIDGGLRKQSRSKCYSRSLPLITVITIVYNGDNYLEQTLQSVINQRYDNLEYIVIDGGSTDNSLDIIRRYDDKIDYWLSELDQGIADAMNKSLSFSTGDYIVFIHADDYFENDQSLSQAIARLGNEGIVLFDIIYGRNLKRLTPRGFNFRMHFKTGVYHQAVLCKREIFDRIGGFDTDFKIAMDYDFFLRAYQYGIKARHYPLVLSVMRDTGISSKTDWPSLQSRFIEEKKVHMKNCPSFPMSLVYKIYWTLYLNYRKIRYRCS